MSRGDFSCGTMRVRALVAPTIVQRQAVVLRHRDGVHELTVLQRELLSHVRLDVERVTPNSWAHRCVTVRRLIRKSRYQRRLGSFESRYHADGEADAVRARVSLTGQYASVDEDLTGREIERALAARGTSLEIMGSTPSLGPGRRADSGRAAVPKPSGARVSDCRLGVPAHAVHRRGDGRHVDRSAVEVDDRPNDSSWA